MLRNGIREIPDHSPSFCVAKRVAAVVFHEHADHAAAWVGFPVFPLGCLLFGLAQLAPPTKFLEQNVIKLRVAGRNVGTLGVGAIFSKQTCAIALHTKVGAEISTAVHDMLRSVI